MINIDRNLSIPLYSQIYKNIKKAIIEGNIKCGDKLPSKRTLSKTLCVSVNTVDTAYSTLVSEGFIEAVPQKGFYVCDIESLDTINFETIQLKNDTEEKDNKSIKINFSLFGIDVDAFPYNQWKKIIREVLNLNPYEFLKTSPPQGELGLRQAISSHIYMRRGVSTKPENIIIGAGTDNLMEVLNGILDKNCKIAMEDPVYSKSYDYFERMGHKIISIPIDEKGITIKSIGNMDNIALYITPSHQFPLGITMPVSRRIQVLRWAENGNNRYIIEDDYDSEFRYGSKPVPSMHSIDSKGNVIYLGSFSRSLSPSIRISYLVLPEKLMDKYRKTYINTSCPVSRLEQLVLEKFIYFGHFERHINRMRKLYGEKREFTKKCLLNEFGNNIKFYGENAGHHIIFTLKNFSDENKICKMALNNGIKLYAVSDFYKGKVPKKFNGAVMLGYGSLDTLTIEKGITELKKALM